MQDASTGQRPNVGAVCVSIVLHSPTKRTVKTYVKEVVSEEDANGYARWVVEVSKGEVTEEEKVALTTDVYFGYARNKGDGRFHHTFHQDILRLLKTGEARTSTQSAPSGSPPLSDSVLRSTGQARLRRVARRQGAARLQELRQRAGREVGHLRGAAAGAGARVRLHGRRDRPVSEPRGHPRHVPLVRRHRRPHDPRHPREARLQGAVGQLRQGVDRLAAQGRRERRCHHQQRVRARKAQRHQDVEAGGQGERRGGAPSREA